MRRTGWFFLVPLVILAGCSDSAPPARSDGSASSGTLKPTHPVDRVDRPRTVPAAQATLADDDVVIGIVVGGKARAYRLNALKFIAYHVVNDVVNKTAVTVTYCDQLQCVRAFADDREEPLPIGVGGFRDGLLLNIGDDWYQQKTGKTAEGKAIPYRSMPFEQTKWGEWKKAHPDTDVYIGKSAAPGSPAPEDGW